MTELGAEDDKIVVLARGARLRAHAPHTGLAEGAAVRDTDGRTYAAATVERVQRLLYNSEYKRRQAAPGVKIGPRAFGRDRRYPIVNGFRDVVTKA